ncbi:MAG: RDD family protein, partial [Dokdonella sp.]
VSDLRAAAVAPAATYGGDTSVAPSAEGNLPEGDAIHAGFWRRVAAYMVDSILVGIVLGLLFGLLSLASAAAVASENAGIVFGVLGLGYVLAIVITWLYFAKLESSPRQATIGKRVMGLKVTDDKGARISFGRASGRFFSKIVTGLIPFGIGYMLAGWTGRKQALHDMMATTFVVFNEVEPDRPLPTVRPPMPWYGWVLNTLPFVLTAVMLAGWTWFAATMLNQAQTDLSELPGVVEDGEVTQDWSSMSTSGDADAEKALVLAGLTAIFDEVEAAKSESAQAQAANNECLSEQRASNNAWIETIQFGGLPPQCTVQVQLSSSSDIPFAARIERIEWTHDGNGNWTCSSSMDSSYLPWPCE